MPVNEKEIVTIVLVGSIITLLVVAFLVSFVYFYQRRHFAFLQEKEQIRSQFQEELLKTRLEIQEETFKKISEEIHDNIGQTLSFIKLNLNTMKLSLLPADEEKWGESKELLTKVIKDLRNLSRTLNTDFIQDIGLVGAVQQQLTLLEKTEMYTAVLDVSGERQPYPVSCELVLYRVIQELLNNIVKHAAASAIAVSMDYHSDRLLIRVKDNGKGFDPAAVPEKSGLGLRNIMNRIGLINGTITIDSQPGMGALFTIDLPKPKE